MRGFDRALVKKVFGLKRSVQIEELKDEFGTMNWFITYQKDLSDGGNKNADAGKQAAK